MNQQESIAPETEHPEDVALRKMTLEAEAMQKIARVLAKVPAGKRARIVKAVMILYGFDETAP